ncbi:20625_t:CDS:2 [Entrophospora sp. SA101]|nr:20625_t:CDS:2 [Entrophospora sp. SA101]
MVPRKKYIIVTCKKQSTPVSIESFKELNLIFDAVIAEFKKEKEALIDINSKLHTRIEEALDDQYEENNARIVKLGQTQNRTINFFNENAEFTKIKDENNELKKVITELEIKKQAKCIQISKELLDEDPIVDYCPSFLNGLNMTQMQTHRTLRYDTDLNQVITT